ncbi:MAG: hypothetical protein WAT39_13765 [Planctomycetota bacterium]
MLLRTVVAVVCLSVLAPCQNGESGEEVRVEDVRAKTKEEMRGEKVDPDESLTPEQRLERNTIHGASAYCRFLTSMRPAKLMPGQTGTLMVVATLQGHAVLPAPSQLTVLPSQNPNPGALTVGDLLVKPADVGRLEKGYLGRPVYENYAEMTVPVSMAANAEVGKKHVVAIDVKFDLYDGNSAQPIGRFIDRITHEVEVGAALDPAVQMTAKPAAAWEGDRTATPVPAAPQPTPTAEQGKSRLEGNAVVPAPVVTAAAPRADATDSGSAAAPSTDDEGGSSLPILIGAGVIALVLVLLLARK